MSKPLTICLTPVKNEAWILERFLTCASAWADHIIVADQGSDDGSREIARRFPKVRLIENDARDFNEPERQKLLLAAAREIPGPKLLIALDADEFLTANFLQGRDRALILGTTPGTVINFQWACVLPDRKSYYIFPTEFSLGLMDDGSEHVGKAIHSPRLPLPEKAARLSLRDTKVLHLSTIDWERFTSKIRWYQCWEFLQHRWDHRLVQLYRWYHRYFHIPEGAKRPLLPEWTEAYGSDVRILDSPPEPFYRWDKAMIALFLEHGTKKFSKLAVWDVDWNALHHRIFGCEPPVSLRDPRSMLERSIHAWLQKTQCYYSHFPQRLNPSTKVRDMLFRRLATWTGW